MAKYKTDLYPSIAQLREPRADQRRTDAISLLILPNGQRRQSCGAQRLSVGIHTHAAKHYMPQKLSVSFGKQAGDDITVGMKCPNQFGFTLMPHGGSRKSGPVQRGDNIQIVVLCRSDNH